MLRILLIFIGILLLINFIGRILFHWALRRLIRKSQENLMNQSKQYEKDFAAKTNPKNRVKSSTSVGEYVDFEEIK